jgi:spore maturation protein CgeB
MYDIPACGGFLLTDWKESTAELFKLGSEVVVFKSIAELNDLISFYEKHPAEREKIAASAKARIQKDHLLQHRLAEMLRKAETVFS